MAETTNTAPKPSSSVKLVLLGEAAVGKVRKLDETWSSKSKSLGFAFLHRYDTPPASRQGHVWPVTQSYPYEASLTLFSPQSSAWPAAIASAMAPSLIDGLNIDREADLYYITVITSSSICEQ